MDTATEFTGIAGVGNLALSLAIERDRAIALRPWIDAMWGSAARTVVLSLLALLTIAAVLRQLRRQELAEGALRRSEERYEMAMDAANEGHAEWNLVLGTVFAYKRWRALHGLDETARLETLSQAMNEVEIHKDDFVAAKGLIDEHMAGGSAMIELEYRVRRQDGEWRWVHARGRCRIDEAGVTSRLFCAAVDVSERKAAEAAKIELNARLQEARQLEALGTLAGGIAHDFNNILGAILGFGQMAQQHAEPDSPSRRHIDRVLQAGHRARLLVRRILDFIWSELNERAPVNVQQVVDEELAMMAPSLPQGVTVSARLDAANMTVLGDVTQLHQVVMNIFANAAQAVDDRGAIDVTLTTALVADSRVVLRGALKPGLHVLLDVEDNGVGIAPEVMVRIFDPFFTTKKSGAGTGLGLSVVHGIVSDLGGAIDVVSRHGLGTKMSVWLPAAGELDRLPRQVATQRPRGNGEVIMVVDDETALVEVTEEMLAELGYEPIGFESPEVALDALRADPARFDAILTDQSMPGVLGTDLALAIAKLRCDLPIILMSGNISLDVEQRAHEAGVTDLLHKPLSPLALAESIARALS